MGIHHSKSIFKHTQLNYISKNILEDRFTHCTQTLGNRDQKYKSVIKIYKYSTINASLRQVEHDLVNLSIPDISKIQTSHKVSKLLCHQDNFGEGYMDFLDISK